MTNKFTSYLLKTTSVVWYLAIAVVLAAGWAIRDQHYLVPESGIGYWFGIIGGTMMLLILAYPLRKRFKRWSSIGSIKVWFRIHMILGLVGPVVIIFHSGFKLGSFNSSVALFCTLIVASSGLLGRYWYERIHNGLYGRKLRFEEFFAGDKLSDLLAGGPGVIHSYIVNDFEEIEAELTQLHTGMNRSLGFYRKMKKRIGKLRRDVARSDLELAEKKRIYNRVKNLRSICSLGTNEILFSYWHVFHIPLLVMLILSALIHIAAVHLY
jgi:hypothetical protein